MDKKTKCCIECNCRYFQVNSKMAELCPECSHKLYGYEIVNTNLKITFKELDNHIIPMSEFHLKWRFTEEKYNLIPKQHLDELKPLDKTGAKFLAEYIDTCRVHHQMPFKNGLFKNLDKIKVTANSNKQITKWLYQRALPFNKDVYLCWDTNDGMITKWKYVVKYWNSIFYGGCDDLTVFDQSLEWCLLFYHEDEIYFGTNKKYESKEEYSDHWFTY